MTTALDQMEAISDKVDAIRKECGTVQDTEEAYLAEMRIDINTLQNHTEHILEMLKNQKTHAYNTRVGLITLAIFIASGYLTYLTI